jgi:hypothetical protein
MCKYRRCLSPLQKSPATIENLARWRISVKRGLRVRIPFSLPHSGCVLFFKMGIDEGMNRKSENRLQLVLKPRVQNQGGRGKGAWVFFSTHLKGSYPVSLIVEWMW